jgi:hypothetical protein
VRILLIGIVIAIPALKRCMAYLATYLALRTAWVVTAVESAPTMTTSFTTMMGTARRTTRWTTMRTMATTNKSTATTFIVGRVANVKASLHLMLKLTGLIGHKVAIDGIKGKSPTLGRHGSIKRVIVGVEASQKIGHHFIITKRCVGSNHFGCKALDLLEVVIH